MSTMLAHDSRDKTQHHQTASRLYIQYQKVSSGHDRTPPCMPPRSYPHWLAGLVNSGRGDLVTKVSRVAHTPERSRQYPILGIYLRTLDSDARGMTEDETVLNTTLNLSVSPPHGACQVPQHGHRHRTSYRDSYTGWTRWNTILGARQCTTGDVRRTTSSRGSKPSPLQAEYKSPL